MTGWFDAHLFLIQTMLITLLLATSVQVQLRVGVFSFAGIGSYGIGAYATAIATVRYELNPYLALLIGILIATVVGYAFSFLVARLGGLYLGMATIVFDLILSTVAVNGGEFTGGATGLFGVLADLPTSAMFAVVALVLIALMATERGRIGRRNETVREDPELALAMGIRVNRVRRMSFAVSGALGACAGGMNAIVRTTVSPSDIGFALVVLALTVIIVGGANSWMGALIGSVIFISIPEFLTGIGDWQSVVYGAIVALAAIWMPGGIVSVVRKAWRSWRSPSAVQEAARAAAQPEDEATARMRAALERQLGGVK